MPTASSTAFAIDDDSAILRFEVTDVPVDEVDYVLDALEAVVGVGESADPEHTRSHYIRPDLPNPAVGEETQSLCGKTWIVQAIGHEARYTRPQCQHCDAVVRIAHLFGLEGAFLVRPDREESE